MTLSKEKISEITKKLYLARLNIINYDPYFGILLMNINFILSDAYDYFTIIEREMFLNPKLVEEYNMAEFEMELITGIEKYLIKIGVYGKVSTELLLKDEENGCDDTDTIEEANYDNEVESKKDGDGEGDGEGDTNGERKGKGEGKGKNKKEGKSNKNGNVKSKSSEGFAKIECKFWKDKIYETVKILESSENRGVIPLNAERMVKEYEKKNVNWKEQLQEFIQFDVKDYSFTPPDRRFDDSSFFLPDFNELEEKVENILFMIDASGSMSDEIVNMVYNEVKNCLVQFNEKVDGYIGSFDSNVYNVIKFSNIDEFRMAKINGGGGTSFINIFKYINNDLKDIQFKCVVILTDGLAPFPDLKITKGIPILWILTTKNIEVPIGRGVYIGHDD